MRNLAVLIATALVATLAAAADSKPATPKTGGVKMIDLDGGKYHVWTDRVGNGPTKMLTLHGGPGFAHDYLECFEDFLPQKGVTFYYYDQLGVGNSDIPTDASLWTIDRYREEVEQVRQGLGLDNFVLFGHSWGGMLGIEYALKYQKHLKALVISNMTAGVPSYIAYVNKIRAALPEEDRRILDKYEATADYQNPEYEQVMMGKIYAEHIYRGDPWPEPLMRTLKKVNPQIYNTMQGPNEFVINGNFKDWDRWNDLAKIKVPTLILGAVYDEMNPDDLRRMATLIPHSRVVILNGSHLAMYDDQEAYFRALTQFLSDVEKGKFK